MQIYKHTFAVNKPVPGQLSRQSMGLLIPGSWVRAPHWAFLFFFSFSFLIYICIYIYICVCVQIKIQKDFQLYWSKLKLGFLMGKIKIMSSGRILNLASIVCSFDFYQEKSKFTQLLMYGISVIGTDSNFTDKIKKADQLKGRKGNNWVKGEQNSNSEKKSFSVHTSSVTVLKLCRVQYTDSS